MSSLQNAVFEAYYKETKDLRVLYQNTPDDGREKGLLFFFIDLFPDFISI